MKLKWNNAIKHKDFIGGGAPLCMFFAFSRWQEYGLDRCTCHISLAATTKVRETSKGKQSSVKRNRCALSIIPLQNVGEDEKELKMQWEIDRLSKELE